MKKKIKKLKPNWQKCNPIERNQPSLWLSAFFLIAALLVTACSPELQEQASLVEKEALLPEINFEKWYESENKEIQSPKSNARLKFESSVQLTYRYKEVDWSSYKKLNIPSKLAIYEFDFLAPNLVVPFDFNEEFGYEEALKRSKQTLLIYAQGNEVVKAYVVRYYFSGEKEWIADFQKVNYDAIDKNWKGQIDLYSLNEIHLVSFDMVIGQVIGTETMKLGSQDDLHPSQSANITCTTTWTPGPCEPIFGGGGIVCYDTLTTFCYNSSPPLISGFPFWNGSGGFAPSGSGGPAVQSICDFDPTCIPHPDFDNSEDVYVLPEFEVNYRGRMSPSELTIFDNLSRFLQLRYLSNAYRAENLARAFYPGDQVNNCADAFRHAFFNGLNVASLGYSLTKQLGDAHEELSQIQIQKEMDLYNNSVGRQQAISLLGSGFTGDFDENLWKNLVYVALNQGFKIISYDQLVYGFC
ncbi:MAG: hypothetical protein LW824_12810 [Algoriphagus sp.]|jgi:hypothetical protein|nr:hypothetical protein [Algoriphagus sp.]MCE2778467.1 hypothetical protein [Algoriphagus sp.]